MKDVSIIGCGWLGLPVARILKEQGIQVRGSSRSDDKIHSLNQEGIEAFKFIMGQRPEQQLLNSETVFLNIPPGRKDPNRAQSYPQHIVNLITQFDVKFVKRIIFISSTSVYDKSEVEIDESTAPKPGSASGEALLASEKYLMSQQIPTVILRPGGLVGGERHPGRFFRGKKEVSGGNLAVNMIHLDDIVALCTQLIKSDINEGIFNLSAPKHPSKSEFYPKMASLLNMEPPEFIATSEVKKGIIKGEKLPKLLNYNFKYPDPLGFQFP